MREGPGAPRKCLPRGFRAFVRSHRLVQTILHVGMQIGCRTVIRAGGIGISAYCIALMQCQATTHIWVARRAARTRTYVPFAISCVLEDCSDV